MILLRALEHIDRHPLRQTIANCIVSCVFFLSSVPIDAIIARSIGIVTLAIALTTLYRKWFSKKRAKLIMSEILIIDDCEQDLQLFGEAFERAHCHVTTRSRFAGAVETLEGPRKLDLVLLDAKMPGEDIRQMYQRVLSIRPGTPVVIFSGADLPTDVMHDLVRISPPTIAIKDSRFDLFAEGLIRKFRLGRQV